MKIGLAAWHYPHRTPLENAAFFADCGFEAVSLHGAHMDQLCRDPAEAEALAALIAEKQVVLTVHHTLPPTHTAADVEKYHTEIDRFAAWQQACGALSILSFDVPQSIRDDIRPYLAYALERVAQAKIAVEDFGLTSAECAQLESLKVEPRFGYLLDLGHMFMRFCGKNESGATLFTHSPLERVAVGQADRNAFLQAFASKEFPVFEMHLHNNDGADDLHWFLRNGALDMAEVAAAIDAFGFDGVLTIESAPGYRFACPTPARDEGILADKAYWNALCANLRKE